MTALQLAGTFASGNLPQRLFDDQRLLEELRHPHPLRRAAACDAADKLIGLAADRLGFWEGTRAEVWSRIFDGELLQRDIDNGKPKRCPRTRRLLRSADPMRMCGALLAIEALARVVALRAGTECTVDLEIELKSDEAIAIMVGKLQEWIDAASPSTQAA
jgi:hypothetical protein